MLRLKFPQNFSIEKELNQLHGYKYIAGVDEVGRGPLAGPLVTAAVILDLERLRFLEEQLLLESVRNYDVKSEFLGITDSKLLSAKKRENLSEFIIKESISYSIFEVSNIDLDKMGMGKAIQLAFSSAVNGLKVLPEHIITDSVKIRDMDASLQTNINKGDLRSVTVGAASIIAKVYRDNIMKEYAKIYPEYGFEKNKGYGTKVHIEALKLHGHCLLHRTSFRPVNDYM